MVVDTSDLPLPELRRMIERRFGTEDTPGMGVSVVSFSYAKGLPREADLVFDLRFLRNPHYVEALRPLTGRDRAVADYIEADPDFARGAVLQKMLDRAELSAAQGGLSLKL